VYPKKGGGFVRKDYELGLIFNPEVSEDETRALLGRLEQIVATDGGQIVKMNQWGKKRLAYPIEHQRDGLYVFMDIILTPETVAEIERTLKVSEVVLRHLMKRRDPKFAQKERDLRETRAAASANAPAEEPSAEPAPESLASVAEAEEFILSEEEMADVPPAIEESIEA